MRNPPYYRKVAANLAKFHKIDISNINLDSVLIDLNKKPLLRRVLEQENTILKVVSDKLSKKDIFSPSELQMLDEAKNFVS